MRSSKYGREAEVYRTAFNKEKEFTGRTLYGSAGKVVSGDRTIMTGFFNPLDPVRMSKN